MECGVGWHARGRTALKAEHGRSERAPPLAAGERLPHGGRGQGQCGSARARASGRGAGQAGLALRARPKGRWRPVKENKMILFLFLK